MPPQDERDPAPTHRAPGPPRRRRAWLAGSVVTLVLLGIVVVGAALLGDTGSGDEPQQAAATAPREADPGGPDVPSADPDLPTGWGPTEGELAQARELVADWSAERLAGQLIVGRYDGTDPAVPAALVRDLHLAGICVTSDNVVDAEQVMATTRAISRAVADGGRSFPAVIGVDQEGGAVSHLRGVATDFPPFADAGAAIAADGVEGRRVVTQAATTTALELRQLGFTWVFAPVADVTVGAADVTIGSRSPSSDPLLAAEATAAAVEGYDAGGLVSTTKHFPGHGSATADSHEVMPELAATLEELRARDLRPFDAAVAAHAPAVMVSHLDVAAIAPGVPASLAAPVYDYLRDELGFRGVTITDSLGMGAVAGRERPAVTAFGAGADLLLMPADTRRAHATLTTAIESGEISRERAEESAARVVALQLWQQRRAAAVAVPEDVTTLARQAAAALEAAAG